MSRWSLVLAATSLLAAGSAAAAQGTDQAPAAPVEIKRIGDWGIRCATAPSPSPCDMFQLLTQRKTGKRVMSLSIAYMPKQDRNLIQIALPLGVAFDSGVKISAGAYSSPLLQYRRCDRNGCYVEGYLDNAIIAALTHGPQAAKATIVSDDDHRFDLAFSLRGFSDAHDGMMALARQKVSPVAPSPPEAAKTSAANPRAKRR